MSLCNASYTKTPTKAAMHLYRISFTEREVPYLYSQILAGNPRNQKKWFNYIKKDCMMYGSQEQIGPENQEEIAITDICRI